MKLTHCDTGEYIFYFLSSHQSIEPSKQEEKPQIYLKDFYQRNKFDHLGAMHTLKKFRLGALTLSGVTVWVKYNCDVLSNIFFM